MRCIRCPKNYGIRIWIIFFKGFFVKNLIDKKNNIIFILDKHLHWPKYR